MATTLTGQNRAKAEGTYTGIRKETLQVAIGKLLVTYPLPEI